MAPTPYLAPHRLDILYTVIGVTHRIQYPCSAYLDSGTGSYKLVGHTAGVADPFVLAAATRVAAVLAIFFPNTVALGSYVLYQRDGTAFFPVEGQALSQVGTSSGTVMSATEITFTFRDLPRVLAKHIILEGVFEAPGKSTINTTPSEFTAYINSVVTPATGIPGDLGHWVESRASNPITRYVAWTNSLNRRIRRRRGLA